MEFSEIASRIKTFIEREFPNPGMALTDSTDLLEDWFVDSFGIVNTTLFLENHFGIEIRRADINAATFRNIQTLSHYVADHLKNKGCA